MMSAGRLVRSAFSFALDQARRPLGRERRSSLSSTGTALVSMSSLFRPEVAEAQRQNWLGQVQLVDMGVL